MFGLDFLKSLKSPQLRKAWFVAVLADAIQIVGLPLFVAGGISPADTALDVVTAALLTQILGWHWAFLPTFAAELVPGFDLFPTWTAAVFFVTRKELAPEVSYSVSAGAEKAGERDSVRIDGAEILPPGPSPARRS